MTQRFPSRLLSLAALLGGVLVFLGNGCDQDASVHTTSPSNGEEGVDPQSKIRVTFTSTFSTSVDPQEDLTSPTNFRVFGEEKEYKGTVAVKSESQAIQEASLAQSGAATTQNTTGQTTSQNTTGDTSGRSDSTKTTTGDESAQKTATKKTGGATSTNDTLVFTLEQGASFSPGERIQVVVGGSITVRGNPIRTHRFTFRVRGDPTQLPLGELRVRSTSPVHEELGVAGRPRLFADFTRTVKPDALKQDALIHGMLIEGDQSGVHQPGEAVFPLKESDAKVRSVAQRLGTTDGLLPGECVRVTLTDDIQGADAPAQSTQPVDPSSVLSGLTSGGTRLTPHVVRFQVQPGRARGPWTPDFRSSGEAMEVLRSAAGNLRPIAEGVEFVAVGPERVEVFSQELPGHWISAALETFPAGMHPADAAVGDLDRDGLPELVVLLTGDDHSEIRTYLVGASGSLVERGDPLSWPAARAERLLLADLDSNGFTDLWVSHPDREYRLEKNGQVQSARTGRLTVFEKKLGPPDLTKVDPQNPSSLVGSPVIQRVENVLPDLPAVERMEVHDLDADGRPELLCQTRQDETHPGELVLVQNRPTATERHKLRIVRRLLARGAQAPLSPRAWLAADLDGDRDLDVVAWDDKGALLYRNPADPRSRDADNPEVRGILHSDVTPEALPLSAVPDPAVPPRALDLNGDRLLDLVLVEKGARSLRLLLGTRQAGTAEPYTVEEVAAGVGGRVSSLSIADVDGDTGLDLILTGDRSGPGPGVEVVRATEVDAPSTNLPSSFRIDEEASTAAGNEVAVVVVADISEPFAGYTVVLDYDEAKLTFVAFEEPVNFRGVATFTSCPDNAGKGCTGMAGVKMVFNSQSKGLPGDGVVLGSFRFRTRPVEEVERTSVFLAGEAEGADAKKLRNTLVTIDGQSQSEAPVELEGDPLLVSLSPPPPPLLKIEACEVSASNEGLFPARVAWSSPAEAVFSSFRVYLRNELLRSLDSLATEFSFFISSGGTHTVRVVGIGLDGSIAAEVRCDLSTIHRPSVDCRRATVDTRLVNRLTWFIQDPVTRFLIHKNGVLFRSVPGTVFSDEDPNPSASSGEAYEVRGVIDAGGSSIVGPPGYCAMNDPTPSRTDPPTEPMLSLVPRQGTGSPLALKLRWKNAEAYKEIRLHIWNDDGSVNERVDSLSGTAVEYTYAPQPDRGGVLPQIYRFSVVGVSEGGVASTEEQATSHSLPVPVPVLGERFSCRSEANEVILEWDPVWGGYSSLSLRVERGEETREVALSLSATEHREAVLPQGEYLYTLVARYTVPVPPAVLPNPSALERSCEQTFRPLLRLPSVETGVGLCNVLIPIQADLFVPTQGLEFSLLLPEFFRLQASTECTGIPDPPIRWNQGGAGASASVEVEEGPADGTGRPQNLVHVEVSGASFPAGSGRTLFWLVGSVPPAFEAAGTYPLRFSGPVEVVPQGDLPPFPLETEYDPPAGARLFVRKRFLAVDLVRAEVGNPRPAVVRVLATLDKPAGFPTPEDYRVVGFQIHLTFDAELLDLQFPTKTDQLETVIGDRGQFFFPSGPAFEAARRSGDFLVGWIGLLGKEGAINPGINQPILVMRFQPKVPDHPQGALARIELVKPPADKFSMLAPESVPNDGPILEAYFDGGVDIAPLTDLPTLVSVSPAMGSLAGGGESSVNGYNFLKGVTRPEEEIELKLVHRPAGAPALERPVSLIPGRAQDNLLEFIVPAAGLESPSFLSTPFDVELSTPQGRSVLAEAYRYEFLRVIGADLSSGRSAGGELMNIIGYGMPPATGGAGGSRVEFVVSGDPAPLTFEAQVEEVTADGRRIRLRTPSMPGQSGKTAEVRVIAPVAFDAGGTPVRWHTAKVPQPFSILDPQPRIDSVEPTSGPSAGGTRVVVKFAELEGTETLEVLFGGTAAAVETAAEGEVVVITPSHAAGPVGVSVRRGTVEAVRADGFLYLAPRVLSVVPAQGSVEGGTAAAVTVENFGPLVPGTIEVRFGEALAEVIAVEGDSIDVLVPRSASGPGTVTVTVRAGTVEASAPASFTYRADSRLTLNDVEPAEGTFCGGETVRLHGDGFVAGVEVWFGSTRSSRVEVLSGGEIAALVPDTPESPTDTVRKVDVRVVLGEETAQIEEAYTYQDSRPDFIRGDVNGDLTPGTADVSALVALLRGGFVPQNLDAADTNDDGLIDVSDISTLTGALYLGEGPLRAPYPAPGRDPTPDGIKCAR